MTPNWICEYWGYWDQDKTPHPGLVFYFSIKKRGKNSKPLVFSKPFPSRPHRHTVFSLLKNDLFAEGAIEIIDLGIIEKQPIKIEP